MGLFLDEKKIRNLGYEQRKDLLNNKFKLLVDFFFRIVRNNKLLFLESILLATITSFINFNGRMNSRDNLIINSNTLQDSLYSILKKDENETEISKEDLLESINKIGEQISSKNKELICNIISIIDSKEENKLKKKEVGDIFKNNLSDNLNIIDKVFKFRLRFIIWEFNTELIWKQWIIVFIAYLVFLKAPFSLYHWYSNSYCGDKIEKDLKIELFKILTDSSYAKSSEISEKMITQFTSDLDNISRTIWSIPNRLVYVLVSITLNSYFDFKSGSSTNWGFAGVLALLFLLLFFSISFLLRKSIKLGVESKRRFEEDNRFIFERLRKLFYIKSNSSEKFEQEKIIDRLERTFKENKNSLLWTAIFKSIPNYLFIPNIPFIFLAIITFIYSKDEIKRNPNFGFSKFIVYYYTASTLTQEVTKVLESLLNMEDLSSDLLIVTESVLNLLPNEKTDFICSNEYPFENGDIIFDNISFVYPSRPENTIIKNLSFTFENGKKYGIAGKNGIGKSTITKILLKLYKVSEGKVLIGKKNIEEINSNKLHERICHLTNHPTFFNMSIAENVFYPFIYNKERDLKKLVFAAKKTKIINFINSLPLGFETILREGSDLSEGQKQQLEAMKVFVNDYDVYIFDEILSNVHPITRKSILNNIFEKLKNKTIITIDHHYDIFSHMDYVYGFSSSKFSKIRKLEKKISSLDEKNNSKNDNS